MKIKHTKKVPAKESVDIKLKKLNRTFQVIKKGDVITGFIHDGEIVKVVAGDTLAAFKKLEKIMK